MEHCNACDADVKDVDTHIKTPKHVENLKKLENMFKSKVYQSSKRGIDI